MNGARARTSLIVLLLALLVAFGTWLFFELFEKRWVSIDRPTPAAQQNPMLAATRLLERHRHPVKIEPTLSVALFKALPSGTIVLPENSATVLASQADRLMGWVAEGNTLIITPSWARSAPANPAKKDPAKPEPANKGGQDDEKDKGKPATKLPPPTRDPAAAVALASLSERFGVVRTAASVAPLMCRNPLRHVDAKPDPDVDGGHGKKYTFVDCVATITLPGAAYPLRLDNSTFKLKTLAESTADDASDDDDDDDEDAAPAAPAPADKAASTPDSAPASAPAPSSAPSSAPAPDDASAKPADAASQPADVAVTLPTTPDGTPALFADDDASAVRAFAHGKGRIVIIAQNYFNNYALNNYDHAELLLGLADLNVQAPAVTFIQRIDVAPWYSILWAAVPYTIVALGLFLVLLAWSAARRFGPLVPEPDDRRRALMEHVDASGRWLWKSERGRNIMLDAARRATEKVLARRAPELRKLTVEQRNLKLAELCDLSVAQVERALLDAPARVPIEFTQQIQSLQQLRKHYER